MLFCQITPARIIESLFGQRRNKCLCVLRSWIMLKSVDWPFNLDTITSPLQMQLPKAFRTWKTPKAMTHLTSFPPILCWTGCINCKLSNCQHCIFLIPQQLEWSRDEPTVGVDISEVTLHRYLIG